MPLFFCISGYLFKNNRPMTRMAQRLLLPLLIYMLIIVMPFEIDQLILAKTTIPNIIWRFINVYTSSKATAFWFPYSLFLGLTIWSYLEKYKNKILLIICFTSLLIAYLLDFIGLEQKFYPLAVNRIFFILPFIILGRLYKTQEQFFNTSIIHLITMVLATLNFVLVNYNCVDMKNGHWGLPIWSFLGATATVLLLIKIMKIIDNHGKLAWLSYIGKASLTIMFTHIVINQALLYCIGYHPLNFILTIAIGCLLHFFFNKFYLTRFFLLGTK